MTREEIQLMVLDNLVNEDQWIVALEAAEIVERVEFRDVTVDIDSELHAIVVGLKLRNNKMVPSTLYTRVTMPEKMSEAGIEYVRHVLSDILSGLNKHYKFIREI